MLKWLCSRHKGLGKRVVLKKYLIRQGKRKNWGAGEGREKVYLFMLRDITLSEYRRKKLGNPYLQDGNELISQTSMDTPHLETWDGTTSRQKRNGGKPGPKSCKGMATVVSSVEAPKSWKSIISNLRVEMTWTTC